MALIRSDNTTPGPGRGQFSPVVVALVRLFAVRRNTYPVGILSKRLPEGRFLHAVLFSRLFLLHAGKPSSSFF